jgi:hypothetical protein
MENAPGDCENYKKSKSFRMEAQRNKDDDSWNEVSAVNGVSVDSTSFDLERSFDGDEDNHHLAPVSLKLRMTNDDPTIPTDEADVAVLMDFETLLGIEVEAVSVPCVRWSLGDELDTPLVSNDDSTKSFFLSGRAESISGDWMDTSMTTEAWKRLREEEAADAVSMRQLYRDVHHGQDGKINESSPQRWSMSKWTSTKWDYNESP